MPRLLVIANPFAGRGRFECTPAAVAATLASHGWQVEVVLTTGAGDATRLSAAAAAAEVDLVAAMGGDGTVHEVAQGLFGTGCRLAVLPTGSGNDFARGLGLVDMASGLAAIRHGRDGTLDVWSVDERPFFNSLGLLASGLVSGRAVRLWRRLAGLRYRVAAVGTLLTYRGQDVRWTFDETTDRALPAASGTPYAGRWLMVEVCNGALTGGGFRFAPDATPDDGLLDVCLIEPISPLTALRLLPGAARGRRLDHAAVTVRRVRGLTFTCDEPVAYHCDGEPGLLPAGRHTVRRLDADLLVRMPMTATDGSGRS